MCFSHIRLVHQKSHTQISSVLALGNKHADALANNACSLNWRMQEIEEEDRELGVGELHGSSLPSRELQGCSQPSDIKHRIF